MDWYVVAALEGAEARYLEVKAEYLEAIAENPIYATEWKLAGMVEAQALYQIANEFDLEGDIREQLDEWARQTTRSLTRVRGESKSTSQATNLVEDICQMVKLNLLGKYYEARESEEHLARREAERVEAVRKIGQAVRSPRGKDERSYVGMVARVESDRVHVVFPDSPQTAEVIGVQDEDLVPTSVEPYRAVQLLWEREADMSQLSRELQAEIGSSHE